MSQCGQKLGAKTPNVCYVRRKSDPKSQADRSVRKADSAGRLDRDVSTNKRLKGLGSLREGGDRNPEIYTNISEYSAKAEYSEVTPSVFALIICVAYAPLVPFRRCGKERKKKYNLHEISVFL